jgi:nitroimidazol reductase NimA-like FMN-containing flavoprotein (pyridoxamine 5'-phosphate oxidase superfamily)
MTTSSPLVRRIREVPVDEALSLLGTQSIGRLAYVLDGGPRIVPLTYVMHQGSVTFRTAYGRLIDAIHMGEVEFEVDHADRARRIGWSVIVRGVAEEIWRSDELDLVRRVSLRAWAPGDRDHYVRIISTRITGRVIV